MAQLGAVEHDVAVEIGRRPRVVDWVLRHPLALCLPVQAALLFTDLGRLPLWGDEHSSLARAILANGAPGAVPSHTVHPGLYFLLLHAWLAALCGGPCLVGARAFSALSALAATIVVDRCWLRALDQRSRTWFLVLWTLSPALLLYGRMARSYTLQMALASLALSAGLGYARRSTLPSLLAYAGSTTLLLLTHYLPGVAVVAGVSAAIGRQAVVRRRPALLWPAVISLVVIALALAPWVTNFTGAVGRVADNHAYHLFGPLADAAVALVFMLVSFSVGESLWPWMVVALLALAPLLGAVLLRAVREPPSWLAVVAPAAAVAFIGAAQWVSYAFVAPRLLFLLPFYLLLLVHGARAWPGPGTVLCSGLALLSLGGIGAYFAETGFLNQAYVIPTETIADTIRAGAVDGPLTVILDEHGSDLSAVAAQLPPETRVLYVADADSAAQAIALANQPGLRQAWFVRNTHDVSPAHWNRQVMEAFARRFSARRSQFAPYSALDRWLMRLAGWSHRPGHVIELVELRSAGESR